MTAVHTPEFAGDYRTEEGDEFVLQWTLEDDVWHRADDKPAIIVRDVETFSETYMVHGKHHRLGGPAVLEIDSLTGNTRLFWYVDGALHREDGPAVIILDGTTGETRREWWLNGEHVRTDGSELPWHRV